MIFYNVHMYHIFIMFLLSWLIMSCPGQTVFQKRALLSPFLSALFLTGHAQYQSPNFLLLIIFKNSQLYAQKLFKTDNFQVILNVKCKVQLALEQGNIHYFLPHVTDVTERIQNTLLSKLPYSSISCWLCPASLLKVDFIFSSFQKPFRVIHFEQIVQSKGCRYIKTSQKINCREKKYTRTYSG